MRQFTPPNFLQYFFVGSLQGFFNPLKPSLLYFVKCHSLPSLRAASASPAVAKLRNKLDTFYNFNSFLSTARKIFFRENLAVSCGAFYV